MSKTAIALSSEVLALARETVAQTPYYVQQHEKRPVSYTNQQHNECSCAMCEGWRRAKQLAAAILKAADDPNTFTAFVAVMPTKPQDAVGNCPRRFPQVHNELFLTASDASEWAYFEDADEPAPDAVQWAVLPVRVPALRNYRGDTPFIPEALVSAQTP
jgi:hypothetical protein